MAAFSLESTAARSIRQPPRARRIDSASNEKRGISTPTNCRTATARSSVTRPSRSGEPSPAGPNPRGDLRARRRFFGPRDPGQLHPKCRGAARVAAADEPRAEVGDQLSPRGKNGQPMGQASARGDAVGSRISGRGEQGCEVTGRGTAADRTFAGECVD